MRDWRARNPEHAKATAHRNYLANREKVLERTRQRHREGKAKARQAQYYLENRERILAKNYRWIRDNRERFYYLGHRRRALLANAPSADFTAEQLAAKWAYWGDKCWVCGGVPTAMDHVKPIAKGGAHMLCNLRPICKPCNSRKHAKWPYNPQEDALSNAG